MPRLGRTATNQFHFYSQIEPRKTSRDCKPVRLPDPAPLSRSDHAGPADPNPPIRRRRNGVLRRQHLLAEWQGVGRETESAGGGTDFPGRAPRAPVAGRQERKSR
jgi:hypothetical protein